MKLDHLSTLRSQQRWLLWQSVNKGGRPTKIPKCLNGTNASCSDPATWETWDRLMPIPQGMSGVGIALGGGLVGVDMDACLVDGQLEPWASEVIERLATYAEISPSGGGIKLLMRVVDYSGTSKSAKWGEQMPMPDGSTKQRELALSFSGRYFTVTENVWSDVPIKVVPSEDVLWLLQRIEEITCSKQEPKQQLLKSSAQTQAALTHDISRLPMALQNLIKAGVAEGERSEQFHRAVAWLKDEGVAYEVALGMLHSFPYGISSKYIDRLEIEFKRCWGKVGANESKSKNQAAGRSALDRLADFQVTEEKVQAMTDTKMIWRNLIASSHICIWAAPGNGGKTTIARFAAAELAASGHQVWYFQEDASAGDLPWLQAHSKKHGYLLLNSTLANGSPEDELALLQALVEEKTDLSNMVMFFDTLKKYIDLMSKGGSREFFKLMRGLTIRGCTIIALGHTNKHKSLSGEWVFEGVADVRNDVDELYYIESLKDEATGLTTLTFKLDKVRCLATPATFELDVSTMQVMALPQVVDLKSLRLRSEQMLDDAQLIDAVRHCLGNGSMKKTELIVAATSQSSAGKHSVRRVVERYCSSDPTDPHALWIETYIRQNNTHLVSLNTLFKDSKQKAKGV